MAIKEKVDPHDVSALVEAADKVAEQNKVPPGYIEIRLSTKGQYGAPEVFHCRNFSTEDLVHLAVSEDAEVAQRTVEFLNKIIYEDIDVGNFHEKEVIETLFIIYTTFYGHMLTDLVWQADDKDKEYLASQYGGTLSQEYQDRIKQLEDGRWKPRYDIDLHHVHTFKVPDNSPTQAIIKNERTGFSCVYSWPRYGDVLKVKEYAEIIYKEEDRKYEAVARNLQMYKEAQQKLMEGGSPNMKAVPIVSKDDEKRLRDYQEGKLNFMTTCLRAIQLKEIRGKNISDLPLSERIKYAQDPELDFSTFKKIQEKFNEELKIGIDENLTLFDPITEEMVTRKVSFRVVDFIQAIRDGESDGITVSFE